MNKHLNTAHKPNTFNALYALVRSEHKRFQMLSEFVSCQHQNRASSPAKNSTPTDQPQRKPSEKCTNVANVLIIAFPFSFIGLTDCMRGPPKQRTGPNRCHLAARSEDRSSGCVEAHGPGTRRRTTVYVVVSACYLP